MPTDPRKRQKKLERKAAHRKEKKHIIVREASVPLSTRFALATTLPVLHSAIADSTWDQGIGQALLSRELPNGQIAVAIFLVDRYCLGVKSTIVTMVPRATYNARFAPGSPDSPATRSYSPAAIRKYVEGAVAYALDSGLYPDEDYEIGKLLFGDIDPETSTETFEYGQGGMPLYINGPHESQLQIREILTTLTRTRGERGFHFTMIVGDPSMMQLE